MRSEYKSYMCRLLTLQHSAPKLRNKLVFNVSALDFDIQLFFHYFSHATTQRVKNEISDLVEKM